MTSPNDSGHTVTVLISGGFELAYRRCLPDFEDDTGIRVETLSGASQGQGPKTIRHQLDHGARVDVVILSNEGLEDLREAGHIAGNPALELATAPLAAAVREGAPRPDVKSVAALTRALSEARLVVMPGSTSGLFIQHSVLPKLGIAGTVRMKVYPRGADATAALASGDADMALGPISELVNIPGVQPIGALPDEVQLVQTFTAAIVRTARNSQAASRLMDFLRTDKARAAMRGAGMEPVLPSGERMSRDGHEMEDQIDPET